MWNEEIQIEDSETQVLDEQTEEIRESEVPEMDEPDQVRGGSLWWVLVVVLGAVTIAFPIIMALRAASP